MGARTRGVALLLCGLLLAFAETAPAQDTIRVPIPREQLPPDTFVNREARDTVPADSILPAPNLPDFIRPAAGGWWNATYEWSGAELQRFSGVSLLELLERVPGLVVTRAGAFGRPAGVAAFGRGGGRLRVFRDGYELDALSAADFDLQQIPLAGLAAVRVERRLTESRIELTSFRQRDRRPFSEIEAGTGDPQTRFLRGLYAQTVGGATTFLGAFDVADTEGFRRVDAFGVNSLVARLSRLISPRTGLEVEYRQTGVDRFGPPFPEVAVRREALLRGRTQPAPAFTLEGWAGRAARTPGAGDSLGVELQSAQVGARAGFQQALLGVEGSARARFGEGGYTGPGVELAARADFRPIPALAATGAVRSSSIRGVTGVEFDGSARLALFGGFSVFGSLAVGERPVPFLADQTAQREGVRLRTERLRLHVDTALIATREPDFPVITSQSSAARAGAEWEYRGASAGADLVTTAATTWVPFGPAFDVRGTPRRADPVAGIEGYASLPVPVLRVPFLRSARLDAWYSRWQEVGEASFFPAEPPFLPMDQARASLQFHEVFREGNFEPTFRVEVVRRGESFGPAGPVNAPYTLVSAFLQLRILDVRIFGIAQNVTAEREAADIAGLDLPPIPYFYYGVRWFFRN
ncbi:hypothetical protein BH23GEM5_BH23GEM5_08560 [soil metagenome]